jgi:hypothetical protein
VCIVTYGELLAMAHANTATLGAKAEADIHATMSELNVINVDDEDVLQAYARDLHAPPEPPEKLSYERRREAGTA